MNAHQKSPQTQQPEDDPNGASDSIAAIDLGSNSFHLVIARIGDELTVIDRIRDPVRVAAGLDDRDRLAAETLDRALACLERFGQRLKGLPQSAVRAVGTQTLRRATEPTDLVERMGAALGFPIEVLPGPEEARLIYLGVAHDSPRAGRRLVIDIGGGSTECILGEGFTSIFTDSLSMGCVTYSQRFFPGNRITPIGMQGAVLAARMELEPLEQRFISTGWDEAVGASGTVNAVADIFRANKWSEGTITHSGLRELRDLCLQADDAEQLAIPGLQAERKPIIAGGIAILLAVFEALGLKRIEPVKAALREGLLYDLMGRIRHEDVRDRTIRALSERYQVDTEQAYRVERTALTLLDACQETWELPPIEGRRLLIWAARLHEVGLAIAFSGQHKHGAYILANSNLPGFSRGDQVSLATLVRLQRRKLTRELLENVAKDSRDIILRLALLLRVAVRLHRARSTSALPTLVASAQSTGLRLDFPERWIDEHPLTAADLEEERVSLAGVGFTFGFS